MIETPKKKLKLSKQTIRTLQDSQLEVVAGGMMHDTIIPDTHTCGQSGCWLQCC